MADPAQVTAYEEAITRVAIATVHARQHTRGFTVAPTAAQHLLCECEAALSSLIALGAVPPPPGYVIRPPEPGPRELAP